MHSLKPLRDRTGQHSGGTRISLVRVANFLKHLKKRDIRPKHDIGMNFANQFPPPLRSTLKTLSILIKAIQVFLLN